jgi:hypothetical protein
VLAEPFAGITLLADRPPPPFVGEIPIDGARETGLEGFLRLPAEIAFDLRGVDGVAPVMARAVGDETDLVTITPAARARPFLSSRSQIVSTTERLVRSDRPPTL